MVYKKINNIKSLENHLNKGQSVVKFYSKTCYPCQIFGPKYITLSHRYPTINFLDIDVESDVMKDVKVQISGVPSTFIIKNNKILDRVVGGDDNELMTKLDNLM